MAKTIKFNLVLDGFHSRTLDDLREHFSIEDVWKYYENGLLLRWLKVRGYSEQYEAVEKVDKSQDITDIIKQLIRIFEVESNEAEIDKDIYILRYLREDQERKKRYKDDSFEAKRVLDNYFNGYHGLIRHMVENKDNMAVLKADALEMLKFQELFSIDAYRLYFYLYENAPKAIFAILTVEELRLYWLGFFETRGATADIDSIAKDPEKAVYSHLISNFLNSSSKIINVLGDDLKIVERDTNGMWDALESKDVKVMVIKTDTNINVKNAGDFKGKMEYKDVLFKFPILDGLEFQCSSASQSLIYMEV